MLKILSVPHRPQLDDGYCLPACVQMVLAYWGIEQDQTTIAKQLQTIEKAGTPASRVNQLDSANLKVIYRSGELVDLQNALAQNIPPIVLVYTGELPYWSEATAHAVVLLGIEHDTVILSDPAKSSMPIPTLRGDFELAWDEMSNLYILLQKL